MGSSRSRHKEHNNDPMGRRLYKGAQHRPQEWPDSVSSVASHSDSMDMGLEPVTSLAGSVCVDEQLACIDQDQRHRIWFNKDHHSRNPAQR